MDPYLVLEYNKIKFKTKVLDKAGKHPVWNETFQFQIDSVLMDEIKFSVFAETLFSNDLVGECFESLTTLDHHEVTN
jgi:Ca2+-dependent lipid-binding protein